MTPQRIAVVLRRQRSRSTPLDLHPFLGIFHRMIQRKSVPGLLIDVADYAHVPDGPGIVLIGHEADYGIDLAGGRAGLLTTRKRLRGVSLADALRVTLQSALAAVSALEAEPEVKLRFALNGFELHILDRLAAENSDAGLAGAKRELEPLLAALYGRDVRVERASADDPRRPLVLHIEASGAASADALVKSLAGMASSQAPAAAAKAPAASSGPAQSRWDISVEELKRLRDQGADFVLVDVREPHEFQICNLDGKLIPLGTLPSRLAELDRGKHVVVHCRTGGRSAKAVELLRASGFDNAWNVQGGILAWIDRIDPKLTRY
jgi:rhodanese-related sulfurtransferase